MDSLFSGSDKLLSIRLEKKGVLSKINSALTLVLSCKMSIDGMLMRVKRALEFMANNGWIKERSSINTWIEKADRILEISAPT